MVTVHHHYATHLGPIYSWMGGGVKAALLRGSAELDSLRLEPTAGGQVVDLGAGFGMHAIPLARRGFSVLALDSNEELLHELSEHAETLPIQRVTADLLNFRDHLSAKPDVILCMGDTLAHLPSQSAVELLFARAAAALDGGGIFVLSFRDYSVALVGEHRCIPVHSDADRILTCFLEYDDTHVVVNDLIHERKGAHWTLRASSYQKLRLIPHWVSDALVRSGFEVQRETGHAGLVRLLARPTTPRGDPDTTTEQRCTTAAK